MHIKEHSMTKQGFLPPLYPTKIWSLIWNPKLSELVSPSPPPQREVLFPSIVCYLSRMRPGRVSSGDFSGIGIRITDLSGRLEPEFDPVVSVPVFFFLFSFLPATGRHHPKQLLRLRGQGQGGREAGAGGEGDLSVSCEGEEGGEAAMGGGGDHGHAQTGDFRGKVWSLTGGPYCRPKHWRRNTAIAMFGIFLVCIPIAMKSAELEQRPHEPVRPIPSQLWCKNFGKKEY